MGIHRSKQTYMLKIPQTLHLISSNYYKIKIRMWRRKRPLPSCRTPHLQAHLLVNAETTAWLLPQISAFSPHTLPRSESARFDFYYLQLQDQLTSDQLSGTAGCLSCIFKRIFANCLFIFFILQIFWAPIIRQTLFRPLGYLSEQSGEDFCSQWVCLLLEIPDHQH